MPNIWCGQLPSDPPTEPDPPIIRPPTIDPRHIPVKDPPFEPPPQDPPRERPEPPPEYALKTFMCGGNNCSTEMGTGGV